MKDIYWKKFTWFEKFIFAIGWLGVLSVIFWIIMVIVYYNKINSKKSDKRYLCFFNPHTYKVVYVFGWIYFVLLILAIILLSIIAFFIGAYIDTMPPVAY